MEIMMRVLIGGIVGGVIIAVLWAAFFTLVVTWPGHQSFITMVFMLGGFGSAILSLKGMMW